MTANLSIKHRLVLGFGSILALMGLLAFSTGSHFLETRRAAEVVTHELLPQVSAVNALNVAVEKQRTGLRGYILSGERRFYDEYRRGISSGQSAIQELRASLADDRDTALVQEIESRLVEIGQESSEVLSIYNNRGEGAAYRYHQENVRPQAEELIGMLSGVSEDGLSRVGAAVGEYNLAVDALVSRAQAAFAVAMLIALGFVVATVRSITRPAKSIALAAESVSRGEYDQAIALESPHLSGKPASSGRLHRNELHLISAAISHMAATLARREKTLKAYADISAVCASTIEVERLLDCTLEEIARCTHSEVAVMYIADDDGLSAKGTFGMSQEAAGTALTGPDGLVEHAAKSRKPIVLTDIPDDTRFVIQPGLGKALPASIVCVPMNRENSNLGVVVLASLRRYEPESIALMESAVAQVGVALSNALRHQNVKILAENLRDMNEQLDAQNEELQCHNEEMQAQNEEIQAQSEEIAAQNEELLSQRNELVEQNQELEALTKDLAALQSVTAVALSSLDQDELLGRLLETVTGSLGLDFGMVLKANERDRTLTLQVSHGIEADAGNPLVLRIGEGFAGRVAEFRRIESVVDTVDNRQVEAGIKHLGIRALVGIPLATNDRLHGVILLGSADRREFTEREHQLLRMFGERVVVAVDRAQAYERVIAAEARARTDRESLQMIIDNMPEGVVIVTAPDGYVYSINKAALSIYGLESVPAASVDEHAGKFNLCRPDGTDIPSEDLPLSRSLMKGEICTGEEIMIRRPSGEQVTVLCNTVPIKDSDGVITGAIGIFQDISAIKREQQALQETYEHQRSIAETLQKSFLPEMPPVVPGFEIADAYLPAQEDAQIGGDFYDLIELGNGVLGVVIGDVSGKGVDAAVYTAMVKYMLRAFAHEDYEPSSVLARVNEAITSYTHGEVFITVFYGLLYVDEKKLVYTNGGHELPLLMKAKEKKCLYLSSTGPAVGVIPGGEYSQMTIHMEEGDAFVLYTDGITEARRNKDFLGIEGLQFMVRKLGGMSAQQMTSSILSGVHAYANGRLHDDIALLVIRPCETEHTPIV